MAEFTLTAEQQAVVEHRGGTLLVSAAAGSGKTRVLVERLMRYLCDPEHPVNIDAFLMITYTKAAAAELRAKIAAELSARLSAEPGSRQLQRQLIRLHSAQISTVHSFCAALLREYAHLLGLTADFRVMEQSETELLREQVLEQTLEQAYAEISDHPGRAELFDTLGAGRDDRALPGVILTLDEQVQCHRDPEEWMRRSLRQLELDPAADAAETPWGAYLLARLQQTLDRSIDRMERACGEMLGIPELEQAYLPVFQQGCAQLRQLRSCDSWDDVVAFGAPEKGRLKPVRKFDDPLLLERLKALRTDCFDEVEDARSAFTDPSAVVLADQASSGEHLGALFELVRQFRSQYQAEKERLHAMDFGDLEHNTLKLLSTASGAPSAAARQISGRYCEIMVDEYQDTNEVQDAIFSCLSRNGENRFLVGDVKQSIYRFRLADPSIFLKKYQDYPLKEQGILQPRAKILLSRNFRSRPEILAAVNDVFHGVMSAAAGELDYGEAEALRPGRLCQPAERPPVELHCISTAPAGDEDAPGKAEAEAAFVAGRIAQLLSGGEQIEDGGVHRPLRPEDVVILMRSPRSSASVYLAALWSAGIPGSFEQAGNLLDTVEVQLFHAMLQVVDNPRQDIPLCAVLLSPLFGFTASELAIIRGKTRRESLYDALCQARGQGKAAAFLAQLERFRALRPLLPLAELAEMICSELQFEALLSAMPDAAARRSNLRAFLQQLAAAEASGKTLTRFLSDLEQLQARGGALPAAAPAAGGAVRIMSIHSSKGLEFPVVVLADLSRRFNLEDLRAQVLTHPQWGAASSTVDRQKLIRYPTLAKQALAQVKERETKSEEMRVLYVAMTRAREKLIMTYCAARLDRTLQRLEAAACYPLPPETALRASCPGDWVLLTALTRAEADALRAGTLDPGQLRRAEPAWEIAYHDSSPAQKLAAAPEAARAASGTSWPEPEQLRRSVAFQYAHTAATRIPAKLTATQLKGRALDEELADGTQLQPQQPAMKFPLPDFMNIGTLDAAGRGTAMHLFMQFADYACCADETGVRQELERLRNLEFLTPQQAQAVQVEKVLAFFRSELGQRVRQSSGLVREFKFSVFAPAEAYYGSGCQDEILLQGVVDCCLNEPEGLTILDFKTDRIQPGGERARAEYYRGQLEAYSSALERIFAKPVRARILYFFATGTAFQI